MRKSNLKLDQHRELTPQIGRRKLPSVLTSFRLSSASRTRKTARRVPARKYYQRVIVKARVVKMPRGLASLRAHVRYLKRSGTGRESKIPSFVSEFGEVTDRIKNWSNDPHHFRFILSPERGGDLDLDRFTKSVVRDLEAELGKKLEWFSVAHYNTDNPHSHLVVRGRDVEGEPLIIPKEVIKRGFRKICEREATLELGYITEQRTVTIEFEREGPIPLDRKIAGLVAKHGRVSSYVISNSEERLNILKRLAALERFGLAKEVTVGEWEVSTRADEILRKRAKSEQLLELICKEFGAIEGNVVDLAEQSPAQDGLMGRVRGVAITNELYGEKVVLIEGVDGINYLKKAREEELNTTGEIVRVWERPLGAVDEVIKRHSVNGELDLKALKRAARGWRIPAGLTFEDYFSKFEERVSGLVKLGALRPRGQENYLVSPNFTEVICESLGTRARQHLLETVHRGALEDAVTSNRLTFLDVIDGQISGQRFGAEVITLLSKREAFLTSKGIDRVSEKGRAILNAELERELLAPFSHLKKGVATGRRIRGKVIRLIPTATGQRVVIQDQSSVYILSLQRRGAAPKIGEELTFTARREVSHGISLQILEQARLEKIRML